MSLSLSDFDALFWRSFFYPPERLLSIALNMTPFLMIVFGREPSTLVSLHSTLFLPRVNFLWEGLIHLIP
jgi:hypothetical protein